jgi:hypothetical protein
MRFKRSYTPRIFAAFETLSGATTIVHPEMISDTQARNTVRMHRHNSILADRNGR